MTPATARHEERHEWTFHLTGGRLCVDLANTVSWRRSGQPIERLRTYEDLVAWARQSRLVTDVEAQRLAREARRRPAVALAVLRRVRRFREATYAVLAALAGGQKPPTRALGLVNAMLRAGVRHLELAPARKGFAVAWTGGDPLLMRILWPAVRSVAEVLTTDDLRRLKICPGANCRWVFLDTTRSGTRRWCDMSVCGNRAKARRYYRRQRRRGQGRPARG